MIKVTTARFEVNGTCFFLHVVHDGQQALDDCCISHDEPISFLDCPVASRWTLVRAK